MLMKNSRTPLSSVKGLSDDQISYLKGLWITTAEELFACRRALADVDSGVDADAPGPRRCLPPDSAFETVLGSDALASLRAAPRTHGMGLFIAEEESERMMCAYSAALRDGSVGGLRFGDSGEGLPHAVRLMDAMPGIRDQGNRGTCSAFASVPICQLAAGDGEELSPQFLYWACKERDGSPNSSGTTLATVQEALYEAGVCLEEEWPYNPDPVTDASGRVDEGQGPAPDGAEETARGYAIACRSITPNSVVQYKRILAAGRPVVVGVMTFGSWTRSAAAARTGKVTMPLAGVDEDGRPWREKSTGGHAMCVCGYCDDASVPGGGYMIVRNSWGEEWAAESEEAAGHAMIPYAYIERFAHSAFTVFDGETPECDEHAPSVGDYVVRLPANAPRDLPKCLHPFARVLERQTRDAMGRVLPKGACVLSLPDGRGPVFEYTEEGRRTQAFGDLMSYVRFRPPAEASSDTRELLDGLVSRRQNYCARVEGNLSELTGAVRHLYPSVRCSLRLLQMPMAPKIRENRYVEDFSEELLGDLVSEACGDERHAPGEAWKSEMRKFVSARIRRCSALSLVPPFLSPSVYVVEAFACPFCIDGETGAVRPCAADAHFVEVVMACARRVLARHRRGEFVFFAIGTGMPWRGASDAVRGEDFCTVVSVPAEDGGWCVHTPGYLTGDSSLRDFMDCLMPISHEERLSAVKGVVDARLPLGIVRSSDVVEALKSDGTCRGFPPFRRTVVRRMFVEIQRNDPGRYAVWSDGKSDSDVYVAKSLDGSMGRISRYRSRNVVLKWLAFHSIRFTGILVAVVFWRCRDEALARLGLAPNDVLGILVAAFVMYAGSVLQNWVNGFAKVERE